MGREDAQHLFSANQRNEEGGAGRLLAHVSGLCRQPISLLFKIMDQQRLAVFANPPDNAPVFTQIKRGRWLPDPLDHPHLDDIGLILEKPYLKGARVDKAAGFFVNQVAQGIDIQRGRD